MRRLRSLTIGSAELLPGDGRTVRVRLVEWNTPAMVTDDGGTSWYRERFARGGLQAPADVLEVLPAADEHYGPVLGRIIAVDDRPDALLADVRVITGPDGDALLERIDRGELSVSVEFDDHGGTPADGDDIVRDDAVIRGLAFTSQPQHTSAAVLGRRSLGAPNMEPTTDTTTTDELELELELEQPAAAATEPTGARSHVRTTGRRDPALTATGVPVSSRYRSFGEFVHAAARGTAPLAERERFYRALSAAATSDMAGLMQTQWVSEVIDLIRPSMPTVMAFSQAPLPSEGLTISQPIITQRPTVGVQSAQNAALSSQKVTVGTASWTVDTYGGGQEMSLQTMLRTSPAYLDQVMRLYAVEMVRKLETDVAAAVLAAADDVNTTAIELSNTAVNYQDAFIDAADVIMGAIDRLPELAVINRKMWVLLAKAVDSTGRPLFPGVSLFNPQGSMQITSSDGEVRGLRWFVAPKMQNTIARAVIGVPEAFKIMLGPVQTLQNDVPETLTHQHAVFQFAAFGKVDASGLVTITNAV